ncbi:MAG: hypothetical protein A3G71_05405 [Gammaproteobacteria bacterium RIFCSPLOWO2_12_FULL_38_14]|nr:MAG: hypothetical protein A2W47_07275 [Gammaproteobacteria bacterium RIFCSPHIGHO2_12_38_15]OGT77496.1 MAG: hypothetical protein A3G71_05405 [Gammaproteobacteria bacterium RIFCSPLOWO2_12_FULL_38_14]
MPKINKIPRYFDDATQIYQAGDVLIYSEPGESVSHVFLILRNNFRIGDDSSLASSTVHLFRPDQKHQKILSTQASRFLREAYFGLWRRETTHENRDASFIALVYDKAYQYARSSVFCDSKLIEDYFNCFLGSESVKTPQALQARLLRSTDFQHFLMPSEKKNFCNKLVELIRREQERLEKNNNQKSKEKAQRIQSFLDDFLRRPDLLKKDEIEKSLELLKTLAPILASNTGMNIKTPKSYKRIMDFAKTQGLDASYLDNNFLEKQNNIINFKLLPFEKVLEVLNTDKTLTTLDLSGCEITDENIRELAEVIKQNKTLMTLDLSKTGITDEGVCRLSEALKNNETLTTLILRENEKITEKSVRVLLEMLKTNRTLSRLYLGEGNYIKINSGLMEYINACIQDNYVITILEFPKFNFFVNEDRKLWRGCLSEINKVIERNNKCIEENVENFEHIFLDLDRLLQKKQFLSEEMTHDAILKLKEAMDNLINIPLDHPRFSEFQEKINEIIHPFYVLVSNIKNNAELRAELLSVYAAITPEERAYPAAQFELASFYGSELASAKSYLTEKSVPKDEDSGEYLSALVGYLVHAENYNALIKEKIETDAFYDLLVKILITGKTKQEMSPALAEMELALSKEALECKRKCIKIINDIRQERHIDIAIAEAVYETLPYIVPENQRGATSKDVSSSSSSSSVPRMK